jgi:hypothetical protein
VSPAVRTPVASGLAEVWDRLITLEPPRNGNRSDLPTAGGPQALHVTVGGESPGALAWRGPRP